MNEKEKIAALMQPRWIVIASYPKSKFTIGEVIYDFGRLKYGNYPHLFERLHWASKREISDMPKYVKNKKEVFMVKDFKKNNSFDILNWNATCAGAGWSRKHKSLLRFENLDPATQSEYEAYINSLNIK